MWWLIVGLFVTQGIFSTLVLCAGGNGHFAMETTHVPSPQHGDSEPCLDAPLLAAAEQPSRTALQLSLAPDDPKSPSIPDIIPTQAEAEALFRRPWHYDLAACDPILSALRTVVLLT
jgi:hypothetical protein